MNGSTVNRFENKSKGIKEERWDAKELWEDGTGKLVTLQFFY